MKKISKIFIFAILLCLLQGCSSNTDDTIMGDRDGDTDHIETSASLETHFRTLKQLTSRSDIVAIVATKGNQKEITYQHVPFTLSDIFVKDVIKGKKSLEHKNMRLIQLGTTKSLVVVKDNKNYLLFLKRYKGPITENAFVITGGYQGEFIITNKQKLKYIGNKINGQGYFQDEFVKSSLNEAKEKITTILKYDKSIQNK